MFTDTTLMAIAQYQPRDDESLMKIRGLGTAKLRRYGAQLLRIIDGAGAEIVGADATSDAPSAS